MQWLEFPELPFSVPQDATAQDVKAEVRDDRPAVTNVKEPDHEMSDGEERKEPRPVDHTVDSDDDEDPDPRRKVDNA